MRVCERCGQPWPGEEDEMTVALREEAGVTTDDDDGIRITREPERNPEPRVGLEISCVD